MLEVSGYHRRVDDLGQRLRAVREAHDLQQMEIARKVVTSPRAAKSFSNYLSRIERGDETNPSLNVLEQIAMGMGLSLSAFFTQLERPAAAWRDSSLHTRAAVGDTAASSSVEEAASHGSGSLSPASDQALLRQLRRDFKKLAADLQRVEARDRARAAARRKTPGRRKGVRARSTKAS